jgi:mRNA interferase RelE/StbE
MSRDTADPSFGVEFTPAARRQFARLGPDAKRRLRPAIDHLENDQRPPGVGQLSGTHGQPLWRIRVGDYRVIYEIHDDRLLVLVIHVGHRGNVYRMR